MKQPCFHCDLPVLDAGFQLEIQGQTRDFCCEGCRQAADTIVQCGLGDYYQYRDSPSESLKDSTGSDPLLERYQFYNEPEVHQNFIRYEDQQWRANLVIEGIHCAACVWLIEKRLLQLPGVEQATVNLATHQASIRFDSSQLIPAELFATVHQLGYRAKPFRHDATATTLEKTQKDFLKRIGVAGLGMMQVMMNAFAIYLGDIEWRYENLLRWTSLILTTPVILYSAWPFFQAAIRDLKSRHLSMDVPVSLALVLAFAASVWATVAQQGETYFESVTMFTFFLLVGRFLEFRARRALNLSGNGLDDLLPAMAHKLEADQQLADVACHKLKVGDHIVIQPGELVPVDGNVISGHSNLDESALNGEFQTKRKSPGDEVFAGSINADGVLTMAVTKEVSHSTVSSMIRLLERAAQDKPPLVSFADRLASIFVALVLVLSATTGIVWYFIEPSQAFWVALSVLVVTCPCALSLATPVALTTATSHLRSLGILPTRGHALQALADTEAVVFDKTGTLTQGQFTLVKQHFHSGYSAELVQGIAKSLELHSEHPIAQPFKTLATARQPVDAVEVVVGQGIKGQLMGDQSQALNGEVRLGNAEFCGLKDSLKDLTKSDDQGQWIFLSLVKPADFKSEKSQASSSTLLGSFLLRDEIRSDTPATIDELRDLHLPTHLLTGDPSNQGQEVAHNLSMTSAQTNQTPEGKVSFLKQLQSQLRVTMVGDGINDAPVMAQANVSIAMASGTELTRQNADVLLLNNHLSRIPTAILLARKCQRIVKENLGWALAYNVVVLPAAMMGFITPWMAAVGMSFSSLIVVVNALRLRA